MFLVVSQVILLLANSGSINQLSEPVVVNKRAITLDDLKAVNVDLNEVRKSLDEIKSNSVAKDDHIEVKNTESEAVVAPLTLDDLKAVNVDLNKVRKSLDEIKSNSDVNDDHIEVNKAESEAVVVPLTLDDLKAVNVDLNEVRKSLDEIKSNSDVKDAHTEVNKAESKAVVVPLTLDDLKAVNVDLNKVRKSLDEINLTDDFIEVEKVENTAVVPVPAVPVVVKKDKENIEPDQKITENKKIVLIEKVPVVIPVPASSDDEKKQLIENSADEEIIATEVRPAYIKHDAKGNSLEDDTEQWTCVYDTNTDLMWEVKSEENVMRNSNNLYSWYNPEHEALQGKADGGRCIGNADCDTHAYVKAMNKHNYCGHNDWHLPTREQIHTLVDFENGDVKINNQYFPRTKPSWYWTSTENSNKNDHAWYVLFRNGHALSDLKERAKHIRLVRMTNIKVSSN